ncbi:MAG: hypothetical protein JWL72_3200, partial [Ilumatobacteraceae bacterium]|nr:hypothetical protein [Ilumatobacteraceae bacterium]
PAVAGGGPDCPFGETGSIWFRASADSGRQAAALGSAPFTYDVSVTLDDVTYTARAVWPNDETPDHAPYVDLHFDPPLPVVRLPAPTKLVIDRQDIESDTPDIVPVACGRDFVRGYDDRPVAAGVPDAALSSFLSTHAAGTFFRLGYEQFHVLDTDSYRYEVRNDTGGLVTVVFVERLADGWAATHWQASPC